MSLRRSDRNGDPRTLLQANSVCPALPPEAASLGEKQAFYEGRAVMYRRVSITDPDHHWEALACAGLEQEKADAFAEEIRKVKSPE